ncbi:MAG: hypothetical protein PHH06_03195 [Candidatus Gracilibacteria bacterium]|nr:hypothetical protein [Candidatus Gracilibacteria bacterium]
MIKLQNMREGEVVEKVVRRHWMAFLNVWGYAILSIAFVISLYLLFGFQSWVNLTVIIYTMVAILLLFILWLNSELDMYIVTNKRIIGVDQISFLDRQVSECSLKDVQEVNSNTKGLFANLLNYGSLTIQTAGNASNFHMSIVPDPLKCARQILNIVDHNKKKPTLEE